MMQHKGRQVGEVVLWHDGRQGEDAVVQHECGLWERGAVHTNEGKGGGIATSHNHSGKVDALMCRWGDMAVRWAVQSTVPRELVFHNRLVGRKKWKELLIGVTCTYFTSFHFVVGHKW